MRWVSLYSVQRGSDIQVQWSQNQIKEPLINSGRADMRFKIAKGKAQIAGNSQTITKICNAAIGDFWLIDADHELIRGPLVLSPGGRNPRLSETWIKLCLDSYNLYGLCFVFLMTPESAHYPAYQNNPPNEEVVG